jgi:hypothetical protein
MYMKQFCDDSYKFSDPRNVNLHLSCCKVNSDAQMAHHTNYMLLLGIKKNAYIHLCFTRS